MNTPLETTPPAPGRMPQWLALAGGWHGWVLGGFSLAATLVLALVNGLTLAPIHERSQEDLARSLSQVIPDSIHDNNPAVDTLDIQHEGKPLRVYRARQGGRVTGVAFETRRRGYAGDIHLLLGIDAQGRLLGVRVLRHTETPGLGDKIELGRSDWITRFTGRSLGDPPAAQWAVKKDGGPFDQFAGATITPRAVVNGIHDGLQLFAAQRRTLLEENPR